VAHFAIPGGCQNSQGESGCPEHGSRKRVMACLHGMVRVAAGGRTPSHVALAEDVMHWMLAVVCESGADHLPFFSLSWVAHMCGQLLEVHPALYTHVLAWLAKCSLLSTPPFSAILKFSQILPWVGWLPTSVHLERLLTLHWVHEQGGHGAMSLICRHILTSLPWDQGYRAWQGEAPVKVAMHVLKLGLIKTPDYVHGASSRPALLRMLQLLPQPLHMRGVTLDATPDSTTGMHSWAWELMAKLPLHPQVTVVSGPDLLHIHGRCYAWRV
jgi:hypothetical protein